MAATIGWDIGGAHVKAARVEDGRVVAAIQVLCPLWKGLGELDRALAEAQQAVGTTSYHGVTMTGELADVFVNRAEGVCQLSRIMDAALAPAEVNIYGGRAGFLAPERAADHEADIASANWHASAMIAARAQGSGLFMDMGSTTTDIIPLRDGAWVGLGYTDAERLQEGELVYTGYTRSFLMAICDRAPFRGRWTTLMNEYFATMADVFRILGELDEAVDQHQTADNREKTITASCQRLMRMIGRDTGDATLEECKALSRWFAEMQLRQLWEAVALVCSRGAASTFSPVIGAGIGRPVVRRLAERLGRPYVDFNTLFPTTPQAAAAACSCAPAAAVALLLDYALSRPGDKAGR
ncbi:hydantoinase/oxoprolinase family protein [Rhodoligotrophos defluvii]|uniref:hydantoinase/oxoprolinase family protein n=1 Tax=Rhodoligotrophos defluvii TaxID=2561934 RepID=UPI0010C984D9|nr:hydantoinase/oxoprolinase family protein [Rhodoligotrophos defluvii]